jgi:hypothetical protein
MTLNNRHTALPAKRFTSCESAVALRYTKLGG